jgi:signal transduction histidine kinase
MNALKRIRILLVEDSETDVVLLKGAFEDIHGFEHELVHVQRLADGLARMQEEPVDVVLLDLGLPDSQGVDTFTKLHRQAPNVPVLILTGLNDESAGVSAISQGAEDFIVKNQVQPSVLARSVRYAIERQRQKSELEHVREELQRTNNHLDQLVRERTMELEAANKELEAFSFSVSHDLRAPLRAIDGFAGMLAADFGPKLPAKAQSHLDHIIESAKRMEQLIEDLLRLSRLGRQPLAKRRVDVRALVEEVWNELLRDNKERNIELIVTDLPDCVADPSLLRQVFVNLLSNALKFTGNVDAARVEVGCQRQDGEPVYFVRDNGAGFDMQYAEKLFGVFQRMHRADEFAGTGVGLSIVARIIRRHCGRIWAQAEVNEGAMFFFTIPG